MVNNIKQIGGVMRTASAAVALSTVLLVSSAYAAPTEKDFKIVSKALSFVEGGETGDVTMDVIYDGSNPASVADADAVVGLLSSGVKSGKLTLKGAKNESSTGAKYAYIAAGAEGKAAELTGKGVVTVSLDVGCATSNKCVLAVETSPKVGIHVSSAAATTSGTSFASAFRMMITEH